MFSDDALVRVPVSAPNSKLTGPDQTSVNVTSSTVKVMHSAPPPVGAFKLAPKAIPRLAIHIDLGEQSHYNATLCAHYFLVEAMWFERRRDTPRHHITFVWQQVDDRSEDNVNVSHLARVNQRGLEIRCEKTGIVHVVITMILTRSPCCFLRCSLVVDLL